MTALLPAANPHCASVPPERDELIERHLPLARRLAQRYVRNADAAEDLEQVAALGLIKAVDRFDPRRGTSFATFAVPTILGELKRHFRDTRWALHVPRDLQERAQRVEAAVERLTTELGRVPSPGEVAADLGLDVETVLDARAAFAGYDVASLDAPVGSSGDDDGSDTTGDLIGTLDRRYELIEDRSAIEAALARLPERDRLALKLRFRYDMKQREIGEHIGVSQMQVSRIIRRSLDALRDAAHAPPA